MLYVTTSAGILTWDGTNVEKVSDIPYYSLCRWNNNWVAVLSSLSADQPIVAKVHILDSKFNVVLEQTLPDGVSNVHQSRLLNNILYITDTANDRIVMHDLVTGDNQILPLTDDHEPSPGYLKRRVPNSPDVRHVNSITFLGDFMYVVCHNFGKSYALKYNSAHEIVEKIENIGRQCHDLWTDGDGRLWTCFSAEGLINTLDGNFRIQVGAFPRGALVVQGGKLLVGRSWNKYQSEHNVDSKPGVVIINGTSIETFLDLSFIDANLQVFDLTQFTPAPPVVSPPPPTMF
jgi:hypothetical protein